MSRHPDRRRWIDAVAIACLLALVFATKAAVLNTPYYWDEGGWAWPAHWLAKRNLLHALPGLHAPETFWGHPTGLHVAAAILLKLFGETRVVTHALVVAFSALGVVFTYLLGTQLYDRTAGACAALALFFSPVWFAQSGMFLADLPVAALGVAAAYFATNAEWRFYLAAATAMVLIKETGAGVVAAIVLFRLSSHRGGDARALVREAAIYACPLLVLATFMAWQKAVTGEFFFIYKQPFELVDSTGGGRKAAAIAQWLFWEQARFVMAAPFVIAAAAVPSFRARKEIVLAAALVVTICVPFVFLYYLRRYLLPVLPFLYLLGMGGLMALVRTRIVRMALSCAAVAASLLALSHDELRGNGEWNMSYLGMIDVAQTAYRHMETRYPGARVLAAWPDTLNLELPIFGYVDRPVRTARFKPGIDLADFDVAIHSRPSGGVALDGYLQQLERSGAVQLVERIEKAGSAAELYVKSRAASR